MGEKTIVPEGTPQPLVRTLRVFLELDCSKTKNTGEILTVCLSQVSFQTVSHTRDV